MQDTNIFVNNKDSSKRQVGWTEFNQLKKDILWIFDENGAELHHAFVPADSFILPYWEYVTINGDQFFQDDEKCFYREGTLVVVLCMIAEYVDIQGGSQAVFGDNKIKDILTCINQFEPANEKQNLLKGIVLLGLSIAANITAEDIAKNEDFKHPDLDRFYMELQWVSKAIIQPYYKAKLNSNYA
ncbi:MAG: hypothetical protein EOO10_19525 [Chitinophagaceae bacterium]|nr:MAG: hypothetical protein EOO10_19525 [Chitinophagaceae bacterium]